MGRYQNGYLENWVGKVWINASGPVAGSSTQDNDPSGSKKGEDFLNYFVNSATWRQRAS